MNYFGTVNTELDAAADSLVSVKTSPERYVVQSRYLEYQKLPHDVAGQRFRSWKKLGASKKNWNQGARGAGGNFCVAYRSP